MMLLRFSKAPFRLAYVININMLICYCIISYEAQQKAIIFVADGVFAFLFI